MKRLFAFAALAGFALACDGATPTTPTPDQQLTKAPSAPSTATQAVNQPYANAAGGVIHQVSVGGHDFTDPGVDKNFSLVGIVHSDGSVSGEYTDRFGVDQDGFHATVTCVSVVGNQAWISGIIDAGTSGGVDLAGVPVLTRVADNGTSANDPPDAISFSFFSGVSCNAHPNLPLFPMPDGQVKVR
jgi:hypothetical protein